MDSKLKVLVIEDELTHLEIMKSKLLLEGYNVVVARDGEEGVKKILEEKPNAIILDILLPKLDGFGVLERMKSEKIMIPVIVVSNSGQPVEIDRAKELGAVDFLVKAEFNPEDALAKVRETLHQPAVSGATTDPEGTGGSKNQGTKILIIEDDKFLRELLAKKIRGEAFTVLEAIDGETGIDIIRKEMPQIVLLDLVLPGLDGFEILRTIKGDSRMSSVPVVVLSNLGQDEDIERAMNLGAMDFLVKAKFTPAEILEKVKEILKKAYIT